MSSTVVFVLEIIGTVAFAVTGAMVALERKLDVFGVVFLGVVTALGGGVVRDLIIGKTPPAMFEDYSYLLAASITSLVVFVAIAIFKKAYVGHRRVINEVFNVFDSLGLGIFAAVGVIVAIKAGYENNAFLCIFVGMTTGCGGGILRDIMSRSIPMVFRKRIYAVAALIGSVICYYMIKCNVGDGWAFGVSTAVVFVIRILASVFKLNLPHLELDGVKSDD